MRPEVALALSAMRPPPAAGPNAGTREPSWRSIRTPSPCTPTSTRVMRSCLGPQRSA